MDSTAQPTRPRRAASLVAIVALTSVAACRGPDRVDGVLLVTLDTTRADHLGCYGGDVATPHLDRLAAAGVRFTDATAQAPVTLPTHVSMMTGQYPPTHGVRYNGTFILPDSATTLAERLRAEGFATAAAISAFPVSSRFGIAQGFDTFDEAFLEGIGADDVREAERPAARTVERAAEMLREFGERPFFLWVHLFDPHWPYAAPPEFDRAYPERPYAAEIVATDAAVGRLLEALRETGREPTTAVVVVGDHGESLGEHGERFHSLLIYQGVAHVPFLLRAPGGRAGVRVDEPVGGLDVFPTVLDLVGLAIPDGVQGRSVAAALRGEALPGSAGVYMEAMSGSLNYGWGELRGLRRGRLKYLAAPVPELFDVVADPAESENLLEQRPAEARAMAEALDALVARMEADAGDAESVVLDEETRERLLSLGYVAGASASDAGSSGRNPADMIFLEGPLLAASRRFAERDWDALAPLLERILAADPENRMSRFYLAFAQWNRGERAAAIATLRALVDTYPEFPPGYQELGRLLLESGRAGAAAEVLAEAVVRFPELSEFPFFLALAEVEQGEPERAVALLRDAMDRFPELGKFHLLAAKCLVLTGEHEAAVAALDTAAQRGVPVGPMLRRDPAFAPLLGRPEIRRMVTESGS